MRAEIAGGGLGGLTLASLLADHGWNVRVHERAEEIREIGAGIFIHENGLLVLEELQVLERMAPHGVWLERDQMRDEKGRVLQDRVLEGEGRRTWAFPRQVLIEALYAAAVERGVNVVFGSTALGAEAPGRLIVQNGDGVQAVDADLIVGADGYRSAVRDSLGLTRDFRLLDTASTRFLVEGRALAPQPVTTEHWSGRRRIALAACGPATSYVYMACPEDDVDGTRLPLDVDVWAASFPHLRHAFEVLAHETPFRSYYCYIKCKAWSRGCIALIGDAAHGLPPCLGQGTGLAMSNSRALVDHLHRAPVPEALLAWEADVRHVTDATQRWSRRYDFLTKDWPPSMSLARASIIWAFGFPTLNRFMRIADRHRPVLTS